jgi:hypothetical protein
MGTHGISGDFHASGDQCNVIASGKQRGQLCFARRQAQIVFDYLCGHRDATVTIEQQL